MALSVDEPVPEFEALLCDGETFRACMLSKALGDRGAVIVFDGFLFSAIAWNWWTRYETYGWDEFDSVPVYGVVRDGPYSVNEFLRQLDSPFSVFSNPNGDVAEAYELLVERDGMAGTRTARRAVVVIDSDGVARHVWEAEGWIDRVPHEAIEATVSELPR